MLADRVCVLFRGEIMEIGPREAVFSPPFHPYTLSLLEAVPTPLKKPQPPRMPKLPVAEDKGGCAYAGRCAAEIAGVCRTTRPPWRQTETGLAIRCHHSLDELQGLAEIPAPRGEEDS
jgi:peptide/nickel transport system ATP-binding protein